MNFSPEQINQDLKAIQEFESKMPASGFPASAVGVWHRGDYLAQIVAEDRDNPAQWRCYLLYRENVQPLAVFYPLSLEEAFLIYDSDLFHDHPEKEEIFTVAILRDDRVAGTRKICPEFFAYALTRYASQNVFTYNNLQEELPDKESILADFLESAEKIASRKKPRMIPIVNLDKSNE